MNSYRELERELRHIEAVLSMLERTKLYLLPRTIVAEPAYWKARLETILDGRPRDAGMEQHILELLARTNQLKTSLSADGK